MLVALLGGLGPGIVATCLAALVAGYLILPPVGQFSGKSTSGLVSLGMFTTMGFLISLMVGLYHGSRNRAAALQKDLAVYEIQDRFRTLADNISQLVWMADETGQRFWYNKPWYDYTGMTPEEMEASGWHKVYHPEHMQRAAEVLQHCIKAGEPCEDTLLLRGRDGSYRWFLLRITPVRDGSSKIDRWFGTNIDITERKRAEQALQKAHDELELRVQERTAELRQAYDQLKKETREREQVEAQLRQAQKMEALGTLTGGIAHDFNNILAAMIGFTELARSQVAEGSREAHHLQRVFEAGLRGRELVRQMLTFSRKTEQEKKPLQLSSIVKETVKLLRASTPSTISIRVDVQSESGLILGDPVQVQQVLMNLCSNAAYAMRENGGVLDVEVSDFSVVPSGGNPHGIEPGLYMRLVVRDTGSGMAPDTIDRIFDPFFTTKKLGEGTGLGLSVVHGIVNQCGGSITVESEPGKSSTFTVYFPKITEGSVPAAVSHEALPTGDERILFVDDEEALVVMGEELLAELGYEVLSRTSSREALALLKEDPSQFDLVITDQTMPDITGVELAKEMLALRPDMPIILCTGFSHLVDEEAAKAAGIRAFAMKPLTKREIAKTIRRVLDE